MHFYINLCNQKQIIYIYFYHISHINTVGKLTKPIGLDRDIKYYKDYEQNYFFTSNFMIIEEVEQIQSVHDFLNKKSCNYNHKNACRGCSSVLIYMI